MRQVSNLKMYKLIVDYSDMYKRGTIFYVIADSKFIGVTSYVLQSEDMRGKIVISEEELKHKFVLLNRV